MYQEQALLIDSGDQYDTTLSGGRVGVFVFDQEAPSFSNIIYRCASRENYALRLDGADDFVTLDTVSDRSANGRYAIGPHI